MPPTTAAKAAAFPSKVSKNCNLKQLREEATFRGLDLGTVPLSKTQLLEILGDGSTSSKAAAEKQKSRKKEPGATSKHAKKPAPAAKAKPSKTAPGPASKHTKKSTPAAKAKTSKAAPAATKNATTEKRDSKTAKTSPSKKKTAKIDAPTAKKKVTKDGKASSKKAAHNSPSTTPKKKPTPTKQTTLNFASASKKPQVKKTSSVQSSGKKRKEASTKPASTAQKCAKTKAGGPKKAKSTTTVAPVQVAMAKKAPTQRKPPPQQLLPRISKKLTLAQLKEEATARQLFDKKTLPKIKADLLHHLVDGSIHVAETAQYKEYQALLHRLEDERPGLQAESVANHQAELRKQEERQQKRWEQERVKEEQEEAAAQLRRSDEIASQACLHKHSFPQVHHHLLAKQSELKTNGFPRRRSCNLCPREMFFYGSSRKGLYTCEKCNWDICANCFKVQNMTHKERSKYEEEKRIVEERERAEEEMQEEEERRQWDAQHQFNAAITKPNRANKQLSTKGHRFVVWCSDGYRNDGWHSYNSPPTQHFDTSWKTAKKANDRARYLFFWKNPWGLDPQEVEDDDGFPEATARDGLSTYTVEPAGRTCWTVGVVPTVAFHHLPEAEEERHNFDDERGDNDSDGGYRCSYF